MMDLVDRVFSRATETDESLERHLRLFRLGRSTALWIVFVIFIFAAGFVAAVHYAGLDPMETLGFGLGGSGAFVLTVVLAVRRGLRVGVDMLDRAVEAAREEVLEAGDEVAD
jgi:hypothetical protein